MSVPLSFDSLYCVFEAPTSTTTSQEAAGTFGGGGGIVIKLKSADHDTHIRTLDMAAFTCYHHEEEHLIMDTRCRIHDIFVQSEGAWMGNNLMSALSLFDAVVLGMNIHDKRQLKRKTQRLLTRLLKAAMVGSLSNLTPSAYANRFIAFLVGSTKKIWLNINALDNLVEELKGLFVSDDSTFGAFTEFLSQHNSAIISPIFVMKWMVNQHTFDLIARASKNRSVSTIIAGPVARFDLSRGVFVTFQPQLTKIGDMYHAEMRLIHSNSQLHVHFNVECNTPEPYFVSLHPRIMTVIWDSVFHVELPRLIGSTQKDSHTFCCCSKPMDQDAACAEIVISTMIHNLNEFGADRTIKTIENVVEQTDMSAAPHSYAFPDLLSTFYGVSNSIISIFDSASDLYFVFFLLSREYTRAVILFIVLTVVNLITSAMAMSAYLVNDITVYMSSSTLMSPVQIVSLFLCFMLLSPALPALEWLRNKFRDRDSRIVTIDPVTDGILLWFQTELIKNQLFFLETIFESCSQIIIQFVAVFVLEGSGYSDVYLWTSIVISVTVIMSKFALLSYNPHRSLIVFNLFTFFVDICFALLFSAFIGSIMIMRIFSFVGLYLTFEIIFLVPMCSQCVARQLDLPSLTHIPFLMLSWFPFITLMLSSVSLNAFFTRQLTHPERIGKKQAFHEAMFQYCLSSFSMEQFNMKLVVINYLCIRSYGDRIVHSMDSSFWEFAEPLFNCPESDLMSYELKSYQFNDTELRLYSKLKFYQVLLRFLFVFCFAFLDLFYIEFFKQTELEAAFGNSIAIMASTCLVLLFIWITWFVWNLRGKNLKWLVFCRYMTMSKHDKFTLSVPVSEFQMRCDRCESNIRACFAAKLAAQSREIEPALNQSLLQRLDHIMFDHMERRPTGNDDVSVRSELKLFIFVLIALLAIQLTELLVLSLSVRSSGAQSLIFLFALATLCALLIPLSFCVFKLYHDFGSETNFLLACFSFAAVIAQLIALVYVNNFYVSNFYVSRAATLRA